MTTSSIEEVYNLIDKWTNEIYQDLNKELELDCIKSLIKESIDPLFDFRTVGNPYKASGLLKPLYDLFFNGKKKYGMRPTIEKKLLDCFIEKKIFDNEEVFDRFKKEIYGEFCSLWLHSCYCSCEEYLLRTIMIVKARYIEDKLKKEIEENKKKKFTEFLDTGLKEISEEEFLEMYKEFTEDQKALVVLNITKKIEKLEEGKK